MQGNSRGTYGSGCKLPGEYRGMPGELMGVVQTARGMHGKQGNARGTYGSGCIVPGECRGLRGECKGVGVKC